MVFWSVEEVAVGAVLGVCWPSAAAVAAVPVVLVVAAFSLKIQENKTGIENIADSDCFNVRNSQRIFTMKMKSRCTVLWRGHKQVTLNCVM